MTSIFIQPKTVAVDYFPFNGPAIERTAPTTEPQLEIWVACKLGGDNANRSYNLSSSIRFYGSFSETAMANAIRSLVAKHEILRSTISPNGEHIYVYRNLPLEVEYQDLSSQIKTQVEQILAACQAKDALHVFDLTKGPLVKMTIFKLSPDVHELLFTIHHIICDGWSTNLILQDLSNFYSQSVQGAVLDLPKGQSFAHYALDQKQYLKSAEYSQTEAFWLSKYQKKTLSLALPIDYPRSSNRTYESKSQSAVLDQDLVSGLTALSAKIGCSLSTTLFGAFQLVIHRISNQNEIVIGMPTAGQPITGYDQLVGHCVNFLPLQRTLNEGSKIPEFLKECQSAVIEAHEHQRFTLGNLLRKLHIPVDNAKAPFVAVVFNVNRPSPAIEFSGLSHKLIDHPKPYEFFELFVNIHNIEGVLSVEWLYQTQLYKTETIRRMMEAYEEILRAIVREQNSLVKAIVSKSVEKPCLKPLVLESITAQNPTRLNVYQWIAQTAKQFPNKTAIWFKNDRISYQYLNETSNQLAHYFLRKGVRSGDIIGVSLDRSPELVITLLAILKSGAAYLPLDPDYPKDRLTFMVEDSSAKMLITSIKYADSLTHTSKVFIENALKELNDFSKQEPIHSVASHDLAYILYTSGTTGKPKGVLIEHQSLLNFLISMLDQPGMKPDDLLLSVTTISFDIIGLELFLPLMVGASIRLTDMATTRDGRALLHLLMNEPITVLQATPSTWRMLLDAGWTKTLPLKALCGGEALSKDLAEKLLARVDQLWNLYGPTETTVWSTLKQVTTAEDITVGKPIANTQVYILNEQLQPAVEGEVGEIWIGGAGVGRGYLNRTELTQERFLANPFDAGRMYRTGDLGRVLKSGEIQCLGRIDHQVKIRGFRIELGEIEYAIRKIKEIKEVVVIAHPDHSENVQLVAYVVPTLSNLTVSSEREFEWKQIIRQELPDYMIPTRFIHLEYVPLSANGKIDRNALPKPVLGEHRSDKLFVSPRTDVEKMVLEIWQSCLKLEKISITDNFFELGGNSLIAVRVMTRLEQKTGKNLPLASLFEYSTIEKLASILHLNGRSVTWDSLVPIKPNGSKIPLYIVHGAGLHVLLFNTLALSMDADQPVFGLQAKGINTEDKPLESIEEIASYYIDAIMAKNPEGPYLLAGYSFGGIIAYEMSKQLMQKGKVVKMLAMFDTYAHQSNYYDPWLKKSWDNTIALVKQRLFLLKLVKDNPGETMSAILKSMRLRFSRLYRKIRYNEDHLKVFHGNYYKVNEANLIASRNYRLSPHPIRITLFRVKKRQYYVSDIEFLGWKPFALKGIDIHEVPGDHFNMFTAPNDKEFAEILQNTIDKLVSP